MKKRNKRGNETSLTITGLYIIGIVVIIIILTWAPLYAKNLKDQGYDQLCEQSIVLHSGVTKLTEGFKKTGLECTAQDYEFSEKTKTEYLYDMYDLIDRCWIKTMGKENRLAEEFFSGTNFALVCYSFSFKEDKKIKEITQQDFSLYMSSIDTRFKKTRAEVIDSDWKSKDNSHFLIEISKDDDNIQMIPLDKIDLLDEEQRYLVVMAVYKLETFSNDLDLYGAQGWTINYLEKDDADFSKHVFIIPESSRSNLGVDINLWQRP